MDALDMPSAVLKPASQSIRGTKARSGDARSTWTTHRYGSSRRKSRATVCTVYGGHDPGKQAPTVCHEQPAYVLSPLTGDRTYETMVGARVSELSQEQASWVSAL